MEHSLPRVGFAAQVRLRTCGTQRRQTAARFRTLRLVGGLLALSVGPALLPLAGVSWLNNDVAALTYAYLAGWVGLPAVGVGLILLPPGVRARVWRWAGWPLVGCYAVLFLLGPLQGRGID